MLTFPTEKPTIEDVKRLINDADSLKVMYPDLCPTYQAGQVLNVCSQPVLDDGLNESLDMGLLSEMLEYTAYKDPDYEDESELNYDAERRGFSAVVELEDGKWHIDIVVEVATGKVCYFAFTNKLEE
jgi:hypothetical protein